MALATKRQLLNTLFFDENPDVVSLTETKTSSDEPNDHLYDTEKFVVYRKDRANQRAPGGGVCILVNKDLISSDLYIKELNDHHYEDSVWCEIKCEGKPIIIGTVYRTPSSPRENNNLLLDIFNVCDKYSNNAQIVICGDFNYGAIEWEFNNVDSGGQHVVDARNFLDMYNDLHFHQHVNEWTHNRGRENPSCLDLIFTKNDLDVENIRYLASLGNSHHSVIVFSLVIEGSIIEVVDESLRYCHHKGDYVEADNMFEVIDWDMLLPEENEASLMYTKFSSQCDVVIDKCIPKYPICNKVRRPKWMTAEVRKQLSNKERAWNRLRARKTARRKENYKQERNKTTDMVRKAKRNFEKSLIKDIGKNTKKFWSYVRNKTKIKETILRVAKEGGILTENDTETAQVVNETFVSVFTKENPNEELPSTNYNYNGSILSNLVVTEDRVKKVLNKLNVNKSGGPDNITPRLLRKCSQSLAKPLSIIFNKSLQTGDVPAAWREANVSPLYKKGDKTNPLNYRPVSLTSTVGKVLETIIRDELVKHATEIQL